MTSSRQDRAWLNGFAGLVALFLVLPITSVAILSFTSLAYLTFPPPGFSLQWYEKVVQDPTWLNSLLFTLQVAVVATVCATVPGVLASFGLVRLRLRYASLLYAFVLGPVMVPTVVTAAAIFFLFAQLSLVGSAIAIGIGHAVLGLPLVVVVVSARLRGFDGRLEQAALSLGAGPLTTFRWVTFPLIAPAVISGAVLAFLTSWDELVMSLFLSGQHPTLPVHIFTAVEFQIEPTIAAVSTLLIAVALIGVATVSVLNSQQRLSATGGEVHAE